MRGYCIRYVCSILVKTGVAGLLRRMLKNKVSIIVYHNPPRDVFENHIQYIVKHYTVISLSALVDALRETKIGNLPKHSLVITFDDGHKSNYDLLPLFSEYGINPTIYLVSRITESANAFWWRVPGTQDEVEALKRMPNTQRISYLAQKYNYDGENGAPDSVRDTSLTLDEIREMADHVDFQSHTWSHPMLTKCDDGEIRAEVTQSKDELESVLRKPIVHFAYPNGCYDERVIGELKRAGYRSARTTDWGWVDEKSDVYRLEIVGVSDRGTVDRLALDLVGIPLLYISILNSFRSVFRKNGAVRICR